MRIALPPLRQRHPATLLPPPPPVNFGWFNHLALALKRTIPATRRKRFKPQVAEQRKMSKRHKFLSLSLFFFFFFFKLPAGFAYSETAADLGSCGPGVRRVQGSLVLSSECPAATEPRGSSRRALLTGAPSKSAKAWRPFLLSQLAPSREPGLQGSDQGGRRRREQHSGISAKSRKKEKKASSELQFAAHPPPETFQTELSLLKSTTYCGLIDTVQLSDNCSVGWGRYTPRLFFNTQNKI
nr:uncharacterized protein LOC117794785 [Marmota flaviventris]